jgi:hypothetical protein
MKSIKKVLATAGVGLGAASIVLAAGLPASAATQRPPSQPNYEWITGYLAGPGALANAPVVPLKLTGAVNTTGWINLGGNSAIGYIQTRKGTLTVQHGNPNPPPQVNYRTCRVTDTINTWYKVVGSKSTGAFWNATGSGRAVVVFSFIAPRYTHGKHKGQCNLSQNAKPAPYGAYVSFRAQGPLHVRHH